jgi:hypothetical protein
VSSHIDLQRANIEVVDAATAAIVSYSFDGVRKSKLDIAPPGLIEAAVRTQDGWWVASRVSRVGLQITLFDDRQRSKTVMEIEPPDSSAVYNARLSRWASEVAVVQCETSGGSCGKFAFSPLELTLDGSLAYTPVEGLEALTHAIFSTTVGNSPFSLAASNIASDLGRRLCDGVVIFRAYETAKAGRIAALTRHIEV